MHAWLTCNLLLSASFVLAATYSCVNNKNNDNNYVFPAHDELGTRSTLSLLCTGASFKIARAMPRMLHLMIALCVESQETSRKTIQWSSVDVVTYLHPESLVCKVD